MAADPSTSCGKTTVDPNEKLFLFGYSCKIFRDDEKFNYIDKGHHLMSWMGDGTLLMDRYDVRGYLHDLKPYEASSGGHELPQTEEEALCEEERYRSLRTDMSEEQLYQEEELKRLRAAIADDGAYHEIGFSYDDTENGDFESKKDDKAQEPEEELYKAPEGLKIIKGMEVPHTMKIHAIIEKTAEFISEQGGQMEIIIKMKQQGNPQFGFMHLDNALYPYYKHMMKEIKSGAYKPVQVKKVSQSEDEDDDDHYLHPSLSGKAHTTPKFTVPAINFRRSHDDSYSLLVKNLKQHVQEEENEGYHESFPIIPPPPDLQAIVDKMALYVAKNGEDFETIVKGRNDKRFDFLETTSRYYGYYIHKKKNALSQIEPTSADKSQEGEKSETSDQPIDSNTSSPQVPIKDEDSLDEIYEQSPKGSEQSPKGLVYGPEPQFSREASSDSYDFMDSPNIQSSPSEQRSRSSKLKGPISFSLKTKEPEPTVDKTKVPTGLLGTYSDEDSSDEMKLENCNADSEDVFDAPDSKTDWMIDNLLEENFAKAKHEEAKLAMSAEDRIKDKLVATARERMVQQRREHQQRLEEERRAEQLQRDRQLQLDQHRKDKQLQIERKKKAELFLKMLQIKNPEGQSEEWPGMASEKGDTEFDSNGRPQFSSLLPGIRGEWSSNSEESGPEVPISVIGEVDSEIESEEKQPDQSSESSRHDKKKKKKKKKKHSRDHSRSRDKSASKRKRSRSPSRKSKRKELPAAYARDSDVPHTKSRSSSRSPRRHRSPLSIYHRRR